MIMCLAFSLTKTCLQETYPLRHTSEATAGTRTAVLEFLR